MTTGQIIAIAAFIVPSATALLVGYWHRKQLRQIEAFRRDSTVGLKPPASPPWAFVVRHRTLLVGVGLPALVLAATLSQTGPITRGTIFRISLGVGSILFALLVSVVEDVVRVLMQLTGLIDRQVDILGKVVDKAVDRKRHKGEQGGA